MLPDKNFSGVPSANIEQAILSVVSAIQTAFGTSALLLGRSTPLTSPVATTSNTPVATGLTTTVTVPGGGRYLKLSMAFRDIQNSNAGDYSLISFWDGTVGSGTKVFEAVYYQYAAGGASGNSPWVIIQPSPGAHTYNVGISRLAAGTVTLNGTATAPVNFIAELVAMAG